MKVIANRQLTGIYGTVIADQEFETQDDIANALLKSGHVRHSKPPRIQYETKVIVPEAPEVSPREPFRDVPLSHAQSPDVASESDRMFPVADLSSDRTTDPRGRGRRSGSNSRR
jgi:hypothetical protein